MSEEETCLHTFNGYLPRLLPLAIFVWSMQNRIHFSRQSFYPSRDVYQFQGMPRFKNLLKIRYEMPKKHFSDLYSFQLYETKSKTTHTLPQSCSCTTSNSWVKEEYDNFPLAYKEIHIWLLRIINHR